MATTNSHTIGSDYISFERDGVLDHNESGKDRDDTSARISFSSASGSDIMVAFNYVSYQSEKNFGRELTLSLDQIIQLKNFIDKHLESIILRKTHVFIFLFEEHMRDEFVNDFFSDCQFIDYGRLIDRRLTKYRDDKQVVGVSYEKGESVLGKVFRVSLYDKIRFDSYFNVGDELLNEEYEFPRKINSAEVIKYDNKYIKVFCYKLNDVSSSLKYNHRPLLPEEKEFYIGLWKSNNFPN